jgi:hypothetical protein
MPQIFYPPYLSDHPINDPFFDKKGQVSDVYRNWFNSVTQVTGFVITHDSYIRDKNALPANLQPGGDVPLLAATRMKTTEIDALQHARNGSIVYDTDLDKFKFRENNAWKTIP